MRHGTAHGRLANRPSGTRPHVLVAGVGGASLGTEAVKSLIASGRYDVSVADISPMAFGLYVPGILHRATIRADDYLNDLVAMCERNRVDVVVPGAEATLSLIRQGQISLEEVGVACAINKPEVIDVCSDKGATFAQLEALGIAVPKSRLLTSEGDIEDFPMPCVVKPSTGSGGSAMVAPASTLDEASCMHGGSGLREGNLSFRSTCP